MAREERRAGSTSAERLYVGTLLTVWLVVAVLATEPGLRYYLTPIPDRAFFPGHDLLKPSGFVGHFYGIAGAAMMLVGVALYSARKRITALSRAGRLRNWLRFHIFLCTLGPYLVLLHTTLKFGGIVSIAFWSMTVVVASGIFGRWVYARIPMTVHGRFRDLRELEDEMTTLVSEIRGSSSVLAAALEPLLTARLSVPTGPVHAMALALRSDFTRGRDRRRVRRALAAAGAARGDRERLEGLFARKRTLDRQRVLLQPFQRLFGYWHLLHMPLAIVLAIVTAIHVVVAILFGYAWIL